MRKSLILSVVAAFLLLAGKTMLMGTSIIIENGQWKWSGNQRDPQP